MPGEIRQLLARIEAEQIAVRRDLSGIAITARHDFIQARQNTIDQAHQRLLELCGPQASAFVQTILENADLLYEAETARAEIQAYMQQEKQQ